ncbi:unnamed protein product, partial [Ranitomeya imitator]
DRTCATIYPVVRQTTSRKQNSQFTNSKNSRRNNIPRDGNFGFQPELGLSFFPVTLNDLEQTTFTILTIKAALRETLLSVGRRSLTRMSKVRSGTGRSRTEEHRELLLSLFHLPEFEDRTSTGIQISPNIVGPVSVTRNENRNIAFMHELQYLFALMVGSNKKYVDPTAALDLLKDAFLSEEAQQQDISEFSHKLLEWLEDAFQLTIIGERTQDKTENPMVQLFYGTFLTEGYLEAMVYKASPGVDLRTFRGLSIINVGGSRKKIHNKLEFPEIIYMEQVPIQKIKI